MPIQLPQRIPWWNPWTYAYGDESMDMGTIVRAERDAVVNGVITYFQYVIVYLNALAYLTGTVKKSTLAGTNNRQLLLADNNSYWRTQLIDVSPFRVKTFYIDAINYAVALPARLMYYVILSRGTEVVGTDLYNEYALGGWVTNTPITLNPTSLSPNFIVPSLTNNVHSEQISFETSSQYAVLAVQLDGATVTPAGSYDWTVEVSFAGY